MLSLGWLAMAQNQASSLKCHEDCFLTHLCAQKVCFADRQMAVADLPWNKHPKFEGVFLKHLIVGKDTQAGLSCHLVKIEPFCVLDTHLHEGKFEVHQVVAGSGELHVENQKVDYTVGQLSVIPANAFHRVVAGKDGLYLLATFAGALQ